MNLTDLFDSFKNQLLGTAGRTLSLQWPRQAAADLGPALLPQRVVIEEGICEGVEARIACFTMTPQLPVDLLIGMPVAISALTGLGTRRLFPVILTEAIPTTSSTTGLAVMNLVGRDPMTFVNERRRLRTFKNMTVQDVVQAVLGEWANHSAIAGSFNIAFLTSDSSRYPRRACFIQHPDESDAQFVFRLLRVHGWSWFWRAKTGPSEADPTRGVPVLELVMFDDPLLLSVNDMPTMSHHRRDGFQDQETIDTLAAVHRVVPAGVDIDSWDHEGAQLWTGSADTGVDQGERGNGLAHSMRSARYAVDHLGDDRADLDRLANVQAGHYAFRSHCLRGRGGVRTMSPATYQVIEGFRPFAGRGVDDRTYTTVKVTHVIENNLPAELHDAAQALAGDAGLPEWAKDRAQTDPRAEDGRGGKSKGRYTNQFYCVPRGTPILPSCVEERGTPRQRRLTGTVIAREGCETTSDELGRVLVRLLGGEEGADTTVWVRSAVAWGGKDHGHFGVLRDGTEVDIEMLGPDRLAIVGVRYNGKTPPPRFDHLGDAKTNAALSGIVSRELGGTRQQQLRFNDTPGNISVQLGTDDAATQINLGSLATPMDRGETTSRGHGAEIRSDGGVSLRSGESFLISAWKRLQALGKMLDAAEHQALMKDFADLLQGLGDYAAQHLGAAADMQPTTQLATDIEGGTAPAISITAPAGIASTTPRTLMSYAGVNIDSVAMQHFQVTAGAQYLMNAGKGASFFVHQGDYSMIAHHGRMLLQSQHDDMQIDSSKDLKVTAAKQMLFLAEKITWMTTKGAFVSLDGGKVTIGGSQPLDINTDGHNWNGPATQSGDLPTFSDGDLGRTPKLLNPMDGSPIEGVKLHIGRPDAGDLSGQTDSAGKGTKIVASGLQRLKNSFFVPRS